MSIGVVKAESPSNTKIATRPTRLNRIAWEVDDLDATKAALNKHFGMVTREYDEAEMGFDESAGGAKHFVKLEEGARKGGPPLRVGIDEHGLQPIQSMVPNFPGFEGAALPIIEIAISVDDAEVTRARLAKAGIYPFLTESLRNAHKDQYNFAASAFHGIPIMLGTDGDAEAEMAATYGSYRDLESAPVPKLGLVTLEVGNIDKVVADFERFFDMHFKPDNACGLGKCAVVGRHRIRLVEDPVSILFGHYPRPVMSVEIAVEDVESVRQGFEKAGMPPFFERKLKSGRRVYYFGKRLVGLPLGIYATADDAEMRGV